jgi:twitching motility protein PilT
VNVGRGALVDEAALAAALGERRLRGAVLDVAEREPLPPESPLWGLGNVLLTPHVSPTSPGRFWGRMLDLFVDNWGRYRRGRRSGTWSTPGRATSAFRRGPRPGAPPLATRPPMLDKILRAAAERRASDVHVKAGDVIRARVDGQLVALTRQPLTAEQTRAVAVALVTDEGDRARLDSLHDHDCSYALEGAGRFRVNIMRQRGTLSAVLRLVPAEVPTLERLGLPAVVARIAEAERGMILVTGVTGSGKSSTLAAMIRQVNSRTEKHVVTLENPIEFVHTDIRSSITQREVGIDTESFSSGLRAALRQDPDVILIGEMRDAETVDTAMKAAETGTCCSPRCTRPTRRARSCARWRCSRRGAAGGAHPPRGVAARRGVAAAPAAGVGGRARGGRRGDDRHRRRARPHRRGAVGEVREYVADGRTQYGMQTFDQHLTDLVRAGHVAYDAALAAATRPADFALQFRMLHSAPAAGAAAAVPAGAAAGAVGGLQAGAGFDFLQPS